MTNMPQNEPTTAGACIGSITHVNILLKFFMLREKISQVKWLVTTAFVYTGNLIWHILLAVPTSPGGILRGKKFLLSFFQFKLTFLISKNELGSNNSLQTINITIVIIDQCMVVSSVLGIISVGIYFSQLRIFKFCNLPYYNN